MIKLAVTGRGSRIVHELIQLLEMPPGDVARIHVPGTFNLSGLPDPPEFPVAERYVLAAGVLNGKRLAEQSPLEIETCLAVNLVQTMHICELAFRFNPAARICIVGSMSGVEGGYDELYSVSKAAIHAYVAHRGSRIEPPAQLAVAIPPIISDAGMTRRRADRTKVLETRPSVTSRRVAELVHDILWNYDPPISCSVSLGGYLRPRGTH